MFQAEFKKVIRGPDQHRHCSIPRTIEESLLETQQQVQNGQQSAAPVNGNIEAPPRSEFGCLIMILALRVRVWSWNERFSQADQQSCLERKILDAALQRWQALWLSFAPVSSTSRLKGREILLLACLPIFGHAQLLLRVVIRDVKGVMHQRDYSKVCEAFTSLRVVRGDDESERTRRSDSEETIEVNSLNAGLHGTSLAELRGVATYAAHALKMSGHDGGTAGVLQECYGVLLRSQ